MAKACTPQCLGGDHKDFPGMAHCVGRPCLRGKLAVPIFGVGDFPPKVEVKRASLRSDLEL